MMDVVEDDEDAEERGVAAGAEEGLGRSGYAGRGGCGWMRETEDIARALGENRRENAGAATKNYRSGAFGEDGKTERKTEEEGNKGGGGSKRGKGSKGRRSRSGG